MMTEQVKTILSSFSILSFLGLVKTGKKKLRDILHLVLCLKCIKKETLLHAEPSHFCVCATSYVINTIKCKLSPPITKKNQTKQNTNFSSMSFFFFFFINGIMGCCHK